MFLTTYTLNSDHTFVTSEFRHVLNKKQEVFRFPEEYE